jgi:hypothetical protein
VLTGILLLCNSLDRLVTLIGLNSKAIDSFFLSDATPILAILECLRLAFKLVLLGDCNRDKSDIFGDLKIN